MRRHRFQRTPHRVVIVGAMGLGLLCLALASTPNRSVLVWNASASMPRGLYIAQPAGGAEVGDIVTAWLPEAARTLAAERRYLPTNVPVIKSVRAVAGTTVCASDAGVSIDGKLVATRRASDGIGRVLPAWSGCQTLADGQVFLLAETSSDSFDGRYFGPISVTQIIAKVRPLWTY
ncbi:MAG: S26 family signal peptidase [Rhodospirillaceae bacterium]